MRAIDAVRNRALGWILGAGIRARTRRLSLRNRFGRESVLGTGPAVSLASYGPRIGSVHLTLESIAKGRTRPRHLMLWLDREWAGRRLPRSIGRLERRGLRVAFVDDIGPHKKYYPFVMSRVHHDEPLVTADDDVLYPIDWLEGLERAHEHAPDDIVAYRTRRMTLDSGTITPYVTWPLVGSTVRTPLNVATGVSGVLYPAEFLNELRRMGDGFMAVCPRADDIWLHHAAVVAGRCVRQVRRDPEEFPELPDSQATALHHENAAAGGNDAQIAATYTSEALARLSRAVPPPLLEETRNTDW